MSETPSYLKLYETSADPVEDSQKREARLNGERSQSLYYDATSDESPVLNQISRLESMAEERMETQSDISDQEAGMTVEQSSMAMLDRSNAHDPQSVMLATYRLQIADLSSQVASLNSKLVKSFDSVGDLEEQLDRANAARDSLQVRVESLDLERKQWEERVEGGLLVEKVSLPEP